MGGTFAVTETNAKDSFDFMSAKPGDVLWSVFWHRGNHNYDEPSMFSRTVKSLEMAEETRRGGEPPEQTWLMTFEENDDRYFYLNKQRASYQPYFWKSREECEADIRKALEETAEDLEEEISGLQKALDDLKTLMSSPIKYDPAFE